MSNHLTTNGFIVERQKAWTTGKSRQAQKHENIRESPPHENITQETPLMIIMAVVIGVPLKIWLFWTGVDQIFRADGIVETQDSNLLAVGARSLGLHIMHNCFAKNPRRIISLRWPGGLGPMSLRDMKATKRWTLWHWHCVLVGNTWDRCLGAMPRSENLRIHLWNGFGNGEYDWDMSQKGELGVWQNLSCFLRLKGLALRFSADQMSSDSSWSIIN
jgi:hypothetical protein